VNTITYVFANEKPFVVPDVEALFANHTTNPGHERRHFAVLIILFGAFWFYLHVYMWKRWSQASRKNN